MPNKQLIKPERSQLYDYIYNNALLILLEVGKHKQHQVARKLGITPSTFSNLYPLIKVIANKTLEE